MLVYSLCGFSPSAIVEEVLEVEFPGQFGLVVEFLGQGWQSKNVSLQPVSQGKDSPSHSSVSISPNRTSDTGGARSSFIRVIL